MSCILEEACEPFPQENSVLGDHDPQGISTSMRVPSPEGL
jgi:hypothetical protein